MNTLFLITNKLQIFIIVDGPLFSKLIDIYTNIYMKEKKF